MDNKEKILKAACELAGRTGKVPSLDVIAREADMSKGGLMHHFRSRSELLLALAIQELEDTERELEAAAGRGDAVATWLKLSCSQREAGVFAALMDLVAAPGPGLEELGRRLREANARWEALFEAETGDARWATLARLAGDGLLLAAAMGDSMPDVEALAARLTSLGRIRGERR